MSNRNRDEWMVWLDLETTGSDLTEGHEIIEVGAILTDGDLNELRNISIVVSPVYPHSWPEMAPRVVEMHTANGLLAELDGGILVGEAEEVLLEWLPQTTHHIPLGGSGISHFDRPFLRHYMPVFSGRFSYWHYDVGVVRRLVYRRAQRPDLMPPYGPADKPHRALADARLHLNEWRHYEGLIRGLPNPTPPEATDE